MSVYGMSRTVAMSYDEALVRIPEALKTEGFGVLTQIDVRDTMKKKLNADFRRYMIFGACNPPLAHQALHVEREIGLMMPCNVIAYEGDDGKTVVAAINPENWATMVGNSALEPIAKEIKAKLQRVLERL